MNMIELKETGLNKLISKGYNILNLETFFTSGPEETRAWTIKKTVLLLMLLVKYIQILRKVSLELKLFLMKILLEMVDG